MEQGAHIGRSVVIKGDISASEPIRVSGRVEGTIEAPGHTVTIENGGQVVADVTAAGIIIAGTVKGSLAAERTIELRSTAEVEGDVNAPGIRVDDGAFVRGKVEVAGTRKLDLARAS
jgi:cytoskeletal protein CcmA (bactofilin family)